MHWLPIIHVTARLTCLSRIVSLKSLPSRKEQLSRQGNMPLGDDFIFTCVVICSVTTAALCLFRHEHPRYFRLASCLQFLAASLHFLLGPHYRDLDFFTLVVCAAIGVQCYGLIFGVRDRHA